MYATTIVVPNDEQLVQKAAVIVEGTVISTTPIDREGTVWTETVVDVARTLKGRTPRTITIREPGGVLGDRITKVFGAPEFTAGERVLLFLDPHPRDQYRVVDLFIGKFTHERMRNGVGLWFRSDAAQPVTLLDSDFRPIEALHVQREAAGFESFVAARVAGRASRMAYGVANPVLLDQLEEGDGGGFNIRSEFTLISEPTIYRWFAFDGGQTVNWLHGGSQPGYSDGGVSELRTAMDSWTGYTAAKIYYAYTGTFTGTFGGMSRRNGTNEVLFNDPLGEISGTWSSATGGVVGVGGFNGVSSGGTWTAPFAADASHPSGPMHAYEIVEGNLVIQDGVSPTSGISSSRLAEIIAHEFGHTLGFGHSADSTALMYATVTGLGPALRDDDELAARWLYPNGAASEPPTSSAPAAPSGLTAAASGTNVDLRWTDNASDETGQSVYLAVGNGSFTKIGDVAANAVGARVSGLSAGTYHFYIVAFNGAGASSPSNTASATVAEAPIASFTVTPGTGTAGVTSFTFYDESSGTVTSRTWSFGDGAGSSSAIASHVYANAGTYTVTLTVSGGGATSQASKSITVLPPLAASFTFSPSAPLTTDVLRFTDTSAGAPLAWRWTFGDGTSSTSQNPSKQYTSAGTYPVTLEIYRSGSSSSTTKNVTVAAPAAATPSVIASFAASTLATTAGASVSFTDQSTGFPSRWSWSFGDGATSNEQHPSHAWAAPGTYEVRLTASNGTSTSTSTRQITVGEIAPFRSLVSVAAQTNGLGGTAWRTELSLFNAAQHGADVTLLFLPSGGGSVVRRSRYLAPRQSVTYENALLDLFELPNGAGALAIEATSAGAGADLRVASRTFTTGAAGTYGQAVPDVAPSSLQRTLYITGMQVNAAYRTNVGFANRGNTPVAATLALFGANGGTVATKSVTIDAHSFQQAPLAVWFPQIEGHSYDALSMRIVSAASDLISAYASVVDNRSHDPVYIQAVPASNGGSTYVPVIGRTAGAEGTFWRSDVTFYNPAASTLELTLRYGGASKSISIGPNAARVVRDVVSELALPDGTGPLHIIWSGTSGPVVVTRTYTTDEHGGTFGQSIDTVAAFANEAFIAGLRSDNDYRSNLGFVNAGVESETFAIALLSPAGHEFARTSHTLAPGAHVQFGLTTLFPDVTASIGGFTMQVVGDGNARLFAYGSTVDNASGDPVFFAGK